MKYFIISNRNSNLSNDYLFIDDIPNTGKLCYQAQQGESIIGQWPADLCITARGKNSAGEVIGNKLAPVIPNICNVLIVNKNIAKIFQETGADIEIIPLTICEANGKPVEAPYFLIHPKTIFNCLKNTELFTEEEKKAIPPTIFRMRQGQIKIAVTEEIMNKIKEAAGTQVEAVEFTEAVRK